MQTDDIKQEIKEEVKNIFSENITKMINEKKCDEDDEKYEDEEKDTEKDDETGEDDQLDEAWKVSAYSNATKKSENITVQSIRDLNRLAKTGTYDYFTVTRPNGQEEEYSVDERTRKLILM